MGLTDFQGSEARPSLTPATQQLLEDLLDNIPEEDMAQAMAVIDQCWTQRASGLASNVSVVSDFVLMPSIVAASSEVKEMMNLLDALPQGYAREIEKIPEGQWKSTIQLGLLKAEKHFFLASPSSTTLCLGGLCRRRGTRTFLNNPCVFMWQKGKCLDAYISQL